MEKVNLARKFEAINEFWKPGIVAEQNGAYVKLAKLKGEFVWHHHEDEDELFFVVAGSLRILLRDGEIKLNEGELAVIPRGVEHCPVADEEVHVMLVEPKSTVNTGSAQGARTVESKWL